MSDGMYEVFAKRNKKKLTVKKRRINKHVVIHIYSDGRVLIRNSKQGATIALKLMTLENIVKKVQECSTN